jgi:hypothetical protein
MASRDLWWEVGSTRNDEGRLDHGEGRILGQLERGRLLGLSCNFSLLWMGNMTPCRIGLCFMTLLVLRFITPSSWSNSIACSEWKRTLSNSNVQDDIPYWGKNFQTESILDAIGDDILLDNRTGWMHAGTDEIMTTWLEGRPTPYRVLDRNQWYTCATRANGRHLQNYHNMDRW